MNSGAVSAETWKGLAINIGHMCSGFHIGNINDTGIVLTAAHCAESTNGKYIDTFYDRGSEIKINIKKDLGYSDASYADAAALYTDLSKDISSVFLLENSGDLPDDTPLHYYARTSQYNKWSNKMNILDTNPEINNTIEAILGDKIFNSKLYVRGCTTTTPLVVGDSGGPIGIPFGKNQFALVGLIGQIPVENSFTYFTSISQFLIPLSQLNIKFNIATYDKGVIEPNTELNSKLSHDIEVILSARSTARQQAKNLANGRAAAAFPREAGEGSSKSSGRAAGLTAASASASGGAGGAPPAPPPRGLSRFFSCFGKKCTAKVAPARHRKRSTRRRSRRQRSRR